MLVALPGCGAPTTAWWNGITLGGVPIGVEHVQVRDQGDAREVTRTRAWRMRLGEQVLDADVSTVALVDADGGLRSLTRGGDTVTFAPGPVDPELAPALLARALLGATDITVYTSSTGTLLPLHLEPVDGRILATNARTEMTWTVDDGALVRIDAGALTVQRADGPLEIPPTTDVAPVLGWPVAPIPGARGLHTLVVRLDGVDAARFAGGDGDTVTASAPLRAEVPARPEAPPPELAAWLAPEPGLQADAPAIVALAAAARDPDQRARVAALVRGVRERLTLAADPGGFDAAASLQAGAGDCTEHTALLVAAARAAGIPARPVTGLVYLDETVPPGFYPHAWAELHLGEPVGWVGVDPVLGQPIADATHLALRDRADVPVLLGARASIEVVTAR